MIGQLGTGELGRLIAVEPPTATDDGDGSLADDAHPQDLAEAHPLDLAEAHPLDLAGHARSLDQVGDADLLDQSRQRPERFAAVYSRYFAEVYRYIAGRLGPGAAEDLAAETFLIAFRRRDAFDPALGSVRPWLYGIATNLISQHQRAETRRYRSLWRAVADPAPDDGHEDRIADRLTAASLRGPLARALDALPAGDRDVLLLVAIAGLSYAEVAQALSISPGTVGSRLNRARRKVRVALAGLYPVPPTDDVTPDERHTAPDEKGSDHADDR